MSTGEGAHGDLSTMRGRNYPTLRQFTVFLENRVGQLLEVVRRFEGSRVRIVALSISEAAECAFVRFLLSHPEQGREILERAGLALVESDLLGVELPSGPQPLLRVCTALLQAEVNILQTYPVLVRPHQHRIGLQDVHFGLQQRGANAQQGLRARGKFHAQQVAFHQSQSGPFQNLAPLFRMAEQKADKGAFGRLGDAQGDDPHPRPFEPPHHLQQLAHAVLQKHGELPQRGIVAAAHGGQVAVGSFPGAHGWVLRVEVRKNSGRRDSAAGSPLLKANRGAPLDPDRPASHPV